jgi:nicotinate phosphoribosyltransferase
VPVAKKSEGKRSVGGRKHAVRRHSRTGTATVEVVTHEPIDPQPGDRDLVVPLVRGGRRCDEASPAEALARARKHHHQVRAVMPDETWPLSRGECALETVHA